MNRNCNFIYHNMTLSSSLHLIYLIYLMTSYFTLHPTIVLFLYSEATKIFKINQISKCDYKFLCVIFLCVLCEYVLNNKNKMDRWSPLSSNVKSLIRTVFGIAFVFQNRTDLDCSNAAQHMR